MKKFLMVSLLAVSALTMMPNVSVNAAAQTVVVVPVVPVVPDIDPAVVTNAAFWVDYASMPVATRRSSALALRAAGYAADEDPEVLRASLDFVTKLLATPALAGLDRNAKIAALAQVLNKAAKKSFLQNHLLMALVVSGVLAADYAGLGPLGGEKGTFDSHIELWKKLAALKAYVSSYWSGTAVALDPALTVAALDPTVVALDVPVVAPGLTVTAPSDVLYVNQSLPITGFGDPALTVVALDPALTVVALEPALTVAAPLICPMPQPGVSYLNQSLPITGFGDAAPTDAALDRAVPAEEQTFLCGLAKSFFGVMCASDTPSELTLKQIAENGFYGCSVTADVLSAIKKAAEGVYTVAVAETFFKGPFVRLTPLV